MAHENVENFPFNETFEHVYIYILNRKAVNEKLI